MSAALPRTLSVLLVEDSLADGRLLLEALRPAVSGGEVLVQTVKRLSLAIEELQRFDFNCVLLDLGLPDGQGVDNVRALRAVDHRPAIVVLTGLDDEAVAAKALQFGAQDYLLKGETDAEKLLKLIRRAVQRNRQTVQLEHQRDSGFIAATRDPLTLLPNLPLLLDRARVQQAEARAQQQGFGLGVLVLDGLETLRERSGAAFAEQRVREVAEALSDSLRPADTLARIAPNAFALLPRPWLPPEQLEAVLNKLANGIATLEPTGVQTAPLHPKVSSRWAADEQQTIEQLLTDALQAVMPVPVAKAKSASAVMPARSAASVGQWQPWLDVIAGRYAGALWQPGEGEPETSLQDRLSAFAQLKQQLAAHREDDHAPVETLVLPLPTSGLGTPDDNMATLQAQLSALGIPARSVTLQVPHPVFASTPLLLTALQSAGFQLLLDCESENLPSLADLSQWPLQALCLHPAYWQRVLDDNLRGPRRRALDALLGAAQALGTRVIVCGVDQPASANALRVIGLRWMQGAALLPATTGEALATLWPQTVDAVR